MKAFKKGEKVTRVSDWDGMGTFMISDCTVYSCGSKQMILIDDTTGEKMGELFRPVHGDQGYDLEFIFVRLDDHLARDFAMKLATRKIAERIERPRTKPQHEPRVITRQEGLDAILKFIN